MGCQIATWLGPFRGQLHLRLAENRPGGILLAGILNIPQAIPKETKVDEDDDEPKTWVSALKVILAAAVLIGVVGLALWYANQRPVSSPALEQAQKEVQEKSPSGRSSRDDSWGIAKDSPIRRK